MHPFQDAQIHYEVRMAFIFAHLEAFGYVDDSSVPYMSEGLDIVYC